jgi:hypothetical protein
MLEGAGLGDSANGLYNAGLKLRGTSAWLQGEQVECAGRYAGRDALNVRLHNILRGDPCADRYREMLCPESL